MRPVSRGIDRIGVTFDEPNLVANAGLLLVATLVGRLGLERLVNATVRLSGRVSAAPPTACQVTGSAAPALRRRVPGDAREPG